MKSVDSASKAGKGSEIEFAVADVEHRLDAFAGYAVFTRASLKRGDVVFRVPFSKTITLEKAKASPVASALSSFVAEREDVGHLVNDNVTFWAYLCWASSNESHEFHPYLSSIRVGSSDVCSWSDAELAPLEGTNLGHAVKDSIASLRELEEKLFEPLRRESPALFGNATFESVRRARAVHLSRRFPDRLGVTSSEEVQRDIKRARRDAERTANFSATTGGVAIQGGMLVPSVDLLNFAVGSTSYVVVSPGASDAELVFVVANDVPKHTELHFDYGVKSNEDFLFSQGFALRHNEENDVVKLSLKRSGVRNEKPMAFALTRGEEGLPEALLREIAGVPEHEPLQLDAEDLQTLVSALEAKRAKMVDRSVLETATLESAGEDEESKRRTEAVVAYVASQIDILEEHAEGLREILSTLDDGDAE